MRLLEIYGYFLNDILNDDEGNKYLERLEYLVKSGQNSAGSKMGDVSTACIIILSGNFNNMGIITNVNKEVTRITGFTPQDLIGNNITRIQPKCIADQHDLTLQNYLESDSSKSIDVERVIFPVGKSGYIVPCQIIIKVLPNLERGIQMVGFMKELDPNLNQISDSSLEENYHWIVYNYENFMLLGLTMNCQQSFGIPASLCYGQTNNTVELSVDQLIPDLAKPEREEELRSFNGLECTLDSYTIQQDFLIENKDEEQENNN